MHQLSNDHGLPINAKFYSLGEVFFDKKGRNWMRVISSVNVLVNMASLTGEDRLLQTNVPDFIELPNLPILQSTSPDLNPVYYSIWGALHR